MHRILVLRGGALGDFIVTLPALALLRERWPHARIELAGNATAAQLAVARHVIDQAHSQHEARWVGLFGDGPLADGFAEWLASFDLVVSYWPDPDNDLGRRFPLRPGQRFVSAAAMPARAPAAAHYCEPLRTLGIEPREYFFRLLPIAQTRSVAGGKDGDVGRPGLVLPEAAAPGLPPIAIHPGSGSPRKNWPVEKWLALVGLLPARISLILGEAELRTWSASTESSLAARETVADRASGDRSTGPINRALRLVNQPLEELVHHFSRCRLFLGHDSGISHLAAASGARCLLLFGPTDPAMWAPPAPNVRVLRHHSDLSTLSVDVVQRAVVAALSDQT